jgi:hypothetical protein
MASNAIRCIDSAKVSVNFNGNIPAIGEIWSFWGDVDPNKVQRFCVEITDLTDDPLSSNRLQTQYTDCYDCVSQNYYVYAVQDCISNRIYNVPAYEFGSLPNLLEVYYMTLSFRGSLITSCFTFKGYENLPLGDFNSDLNNNKFALVTDTPQLNTDCPTCLSSNSLSYEVNRCDGTTDYVLLINNSYIDHLISYSDGINQYCGTVVGLGSDTPPLTFINDYGFKTECDVCLATENQKVLLESCTDELNTQVVWASTLYGGGEVSNLSTDDGCFEVIGLTEDPVTIDSFLNFDPQPGCEPCIECNGIVYEFAPCGGEGPLYVQSYQYLPNGSYFYNPALGQCCQLVGTASGYYGDDTLYSMDTFTDCTDCENNVDIVIWNASACTASNTYSSFYVTTDSSTQIGDVVKLMWGSNEWICAQLLNTTSSYSGDYTYYNTQDNGSGTTLRYDSCENCNSQGLIGVTLVSCETPYTEQFVSISLENYLQIYNFGSLTNYSVSDQQGNCFTITNLCPIPLTEEGFTPVAFYLNCFICSDENPDNPPRSANTENFICIPDCEFTGSTAVSPPHPVWTDGYGTPVTQLNMVVLGGPNGLNA